MLLIMFGLTTVIVSAGVIISLNLLIKWHQYREKEKVFMEKEKELYEKILSSPETSWKKVGNVKKLYYYPLKSGKGNSIEQCKFDERGISIDKPGVFLVKDRMFIVYEEKTNKFQTGRQHPKLLLINISAVDKSKAKLEVNEMSPLVFNLPKVNDKNINIIKCFMWWNEDVECIDCGPETSKWISKFLIGSDSGLKLGIYLPNSNRKIINGAWKKQAKIYTSLRDEDSGLFSDLASYMLLSESSVNDLNTRLNKPISPLQLRPNILIEGCNPYAEDGWEWIKIGEKAIIRYIKRCPRCSMVRIDPEMGVPDPKFELLRTLKTYRKLENIEMDAIENHAPTIGIYCGLYRTGEVKLNDNVYVYKLDEKCNR